MFCFSDVLVVFHISRQHCSAFVASRRTYFKSMYWHSERQSKQNKAPVCGKASDGLTKMSEVNFIVDH